MSEAGTMSQLLRMLDAARLSLEMEKGKDLTASLSVSSELIINNMGSVDIYIFPL